MKPKFAEIRDDFKEYAETWDESVINKYSIDTLRKAKTFYTNPAHVTETWFNALNDRVSELEQSQTFRRETKWKIPAISISVVALVVSLPISIKSCSDSSEALRFSKQTFEETQKPELVLRPSNSDGKEEFVRYIAHEDSFDIIVFIRIENIGRRPATDIVYRDSYMAITVGGQVLTSYEIEIGSPISLSFQQYHFNKKRFTVKTHGVAPDQIIRQLKNEDTAIKRKIAVKYTDASTSKDYVVSAEYLIRQVNFDILQYDHPKLISR